MIALLDFTSTVIGSTRMKWLTYSEAKGLAETLGVHNAPQMVLLFAEAKTLDSEIPIPPIVIPAEQGPPSPLHQWYGKVGGRLITLEKEATDTSHDSILIRTGFLPNQDNSGDWTVLLDLQDLPKWIYIRRPLFIESRNDRAKCVVYRPDPQGWKTAIYGAASQADAKNLLAFMKQDTWNATCFIGESAPLGKWVIVQGESVMLGTGSGLNEALKFACEWSLRYAPAQIHVKDVSGTTNEVYVVSQGRVLTPSERF